MIVVCLRCGADMIETKADQHECLACGFQAQQISLSVPFRTGRKSVYGWTEVKDIAAANKVSYSTYMRRIHTGLSPIDAASQRPLTYQENMERSQKTGKIKYSIKGDK